MSSIILLTRAANASTAPDGSVVCQIGQTLEGEGGTWVPVVFDLGSGRFQAGLAPIRGSGKKAVVFPVVWTCPNLAGKVAEGLAWVAAA